MAGEKEEGECSDDEIEENLMSNITHRIDDAVTRNSNIDLINLKLEAFRTMAIKNKKKKQQKHNILLVQKHKNKIKLETSSTTAVQFQHNEGLVENKDDSSSDMEMETWEVPRNSVQQEDMGSHIEILNGTKRRENRVEKDKRLDEVTLRIKKETIDMNVVLRERMAKLAQEAAARTSSTECENIITETMTIEDEIVNVVNDPDTSVAAISPLLHKNVFSTVFYFEEGEKLDIFDLALNEKKNKRSRTTKPGVILDNRSNGSSSDITATFTYWHEQEQVNGSTNSSVVRVNPTVDEYTSTTRDSSSNDSSNDALIKLRLAAITTKRPYSAITVSSSSSSSSVSHDSAVEANILSSQAGVDPLSIQSRFQKRLDDISQEISHTTRQGIVVYI
jgi:HD-GYP domain-containing protein (c-di-GMP phosphodiesterase class II)